MACKIGGYQPHFVDGELDEAFFSGGRGNTDGDFSLSGHGKLGKLTGFVIKFILIF